MEQINLCMSRRGGNTRELTKLTYLSSELISKGRDPETVRFADLKE